MIMILVLQILTKNTILKEIKTKNILLEKSLFEKKYKYTRNLCYSQFKDKYTLDEFFKYCRLENIKGIYYCVKNDKNLI